MLIKAKGTGGRVTARRITTALALTTAAALGTIGLTAVPAQAYPSACSVSISTSSARGHCASGSGWYRAWAVCTNASTKKKTTRSGPWASIGNYSRANCASNEYIVNPSSTTVGLVKTTYLPPY